MRAAAYPHSSDQIWFVLYGRWSGMVRDKIATEVMVTTLPLLPLQRIHETVVVAEGNLASALLRRKPTRRLRRP